MTPTNPTEAQMKLARECAAKACSEPQRVAILEGQFDRTPSVRSALLAIQATEARAQGLVEALTELTDLMDDVCCGDYEPDSFTTQPARQALETWRRT